MEKHGVVVVAQLPLLTPEDPATGPLSTASRTTSRAAVDPTSSFKVFLPQKVKNVPGMQTVRGSSAAAI